MSGSMKTVLIYGFCEGNREFILDANWLRNNFDDIECFALDVVRNHLGEAVYGIRADFVSKTGVASISEEKESKMKDLYYRWLESKGIKHNKKRKLASDAGQAKESKEGDENNSEEESEEISHLRFYLAVSGDAYETYEHEHYKLTEANKKVLTKPRTTQSAAFMNDPLIAAILRSGLRG